MMAIKANDVGCRVIFEPVTLIGADESRVFRMTYTKDVDEFIVLHAGWMWRLRYFQGDPREGPF